MPGRTVTLVGVVTLALAGCTARGATTAAMPVLVSFYPLYEFAQRIGGERVAVRSLVPAGVEPHDFEPTPRDLAALKRAKVVIYNGLGFEPWLKKLLPEVQQAAVLVDTTDSLGLQHEGTVPEATVPLEPGEERGGLDPHVWLDPVLAQEQVKRILAGFVKADSNGRAAYEANAVALATELQTLHRQFAGTLQQCQRKEFITLHAAFGYMAKRYRLQQLAISGLSPEIEPSPGRLREIVQQARRYDIRVIYYEPLVSPRIAEVIAREVGASLRVLNPLEGLTIEEQHQGKNYFTVMHENLRNLAEGLDCR